jgi:putative ABC transport system permease protein
MENFLQDLSYGFRMLRKRPGFTLVAVLTLALGIGANTAIFSVVNRVLLQPLPLKDFDRLVNPMAMSKEDPFQVSPIEYLEWKRQGGSFENFGAANSLNFTITGDGEPERIRASAITIDYLMTLGVNPILGRNFIEDEVKESGTAVAIISHGLWKRRFGSVPDIVGKSTLINNRSYTIVGVLQQDFDLPFKTELWVPLSFNNIPDNLRTGHNLFVVGRLKQNVSLEQAQEELRAISSRLEDEYPASQKGWSVSLITLRQHLMIDLGGSFHKKLWVLLGAVGFLTLISCANVANLLLARSLQRRQEIAIRTALGAGRFRIARQLLTECLLLALMGGGAGILLAYWITPPLLSLNPIETLAYSNHFLNVQIDRTVLTFTLLISILTAFFFGLPAAFKATRIDLQHFLKEGSRGSRGVSSGFRLLNGLVVIEVAVSITLLVGAGLMAKSFNRLQNLDLGFNSENILTMQLSLPGNKYPEPAQRVVFYDQLLERVRSLPGVVSAATTTNIPLSHDSIDSAVIWEGGIAPDPDEPLYTANRMVSPGYLETMGIKLLRGRAINEQDSAGSAPVAVVSQELAFRCWPGEDPIGKRVRWGGPSSNRPWMTVVGLVSDIKEDRSSFRRDRPVWYIPYQQNNQNLPVNLVVKTSGDPTGLAASVREAIRSVDKDQPVYGVKDLKTHLVEFFGPERFGAILMGLFATVGLILASMGLFGLLSYLVSNRAQEIGIRIALGARTGDILKMVVGHGAFLTLIGIATGIAASLMLTRLLSSQLYGVSETDLSTFLMVPIVLLFTSMLSCYIPARRATKVDPMVVLRNE